LPIEVIGAPTLRDPDGLAMSSRNQYLRLDERARAASLQRSIQAVITAIRAGRRDFDAVCTAESAKLLAEGFRPQYLVVRNVDLTIPGTASTGDPPELVVLAAAWLGATRLIDNTRVLLAH
jgi:pantoate--beta-alanine ligase